MPRRKKTYYFKRIENCASNGMPVYRMPGTDYYLLQQNPDSKTKGAMKRWLNGFFYATKGFPTLTNGKWNYYHKFHKAKNKWVRKAGSHNFFYKDSN